jgi:hypothetical protein
MGTTRKYGAKWTIVQHSGYGYAGKPGFEHAVETRMLATVAEQRRAKKAGGLLFDSWKEAEDFAEGANHPPDHEEIALKGELLSGLHPAAKGTFSKLLVDGLAIYIPVREVTG